MLEKQPRVGRSVWRAVAAARRAVRGVGLVWIATQAAAQTPVPMPAPTAKYASGEKGRVKGPIVMKRGNDVLVRDETTKELSLVILQPATRISRPAGFLNLDRKEYTPNVLIPGLIIDVRGTGDRRENLVADRISFRERSLETAMSIAAADVEVKAELRRTEAALRATREHLSTAIEHLRDSLAALKKRVVERPPAFAIKASATVHFAPGSAELTDDARRTLDLLAAQNEKLEDFRIDVAGFADATGPAVENELLSTARARAVVDYLTRVHGFEPRRFANPAGEGTSHTAAPNDSPAGRARNRRVEVQVLVKRSA